MRFLVPTDGPAGWQRLLADPELHWVTGRSARTMAHAWEDTNGWPEEIAAALGAVPELQNLTPVYGFPEFKVPLPGGSRSSQTDLMVVATDGSHSATIAIEGKVNESFGPLVDDWLGFDPSSGKETRLEYLCGKLSIPRDIVGSLRYQLLHRTASAKIEAERNGSSIAAMLVHSWGAEDDGFADYQRFAETLGVEAGVGTFSYSGPAHVWLGWVRGDAKYLTY